MTLHTFIRDNRTEIDAVIKREQTKYDRPGFVRDFPKLNDKERREWILNHEPLYRWAQRAGCRV